MTIITQMDEIIIRERAQDAVETFLANTLYEYDCRSGDCPPDVAYDVEQIVNKLTASAVILVRGNTPYVEHSVMVATYYNGEVDNVTPLSEFDEDCGYTQEELERIAAGELVICGGGASPLVGVQVVP